MKTITSQLAAHLEEDLTTLATCWKVTRKDGRVLGFTDHDVDLEIDGVEYIASSGYMRSAIANSATVSVDNLEVNGFLDDEAISESDLRNGLFDYAEVEIFVVNWDDLSQGILRLRYGLFGETQRFPSGMFRVELRGLTQLFSQSVVNTITTECIVDLGDSKCTVPLVPALRVNSREYRAGDRVVVPLAGEGEAVQLPLLNPGFEYVETSSGLYGWAFTAAKASNLPPYVAYDGNSYVVPTGPVGVLIQTNYWPAYDRGDATVMTAFRFRQFQIETGWQARGVIQILNAGNAVIETHTSDWETTEVGAWETVEVEATANLMNSGYRLRIEFRPDPAVYPDPLNQPTTPCRILFDDIDIDHDGTMGLPALKNPSFEQNYQNGGVQSWGGGFGPSRRVSNINLQPKSGDAYLRISGFGETTQNVSMSALDPDKIDAGEYMIDLSGWAAGEEWGYQARPTLRFLNSGGGTITDLSTDYFDLRERAWMPFQLKREIPAGARSVQVRLWGRPGPLNSGTAQRVCYDGLSLQAYEKVYEENGFESFGGIEFEAVQGGYADSTPPAFDDTIGNTTIDGTVIWKAVYPRFAFYGSVDVVTDHAVFTVSDVDAPDDWFAWGVIEFLDGPNKGKLEEVKTWDNSTKQITLMLPLLNLAVTGNTFKLAAGCDKSREECHEKFGNILNYRGWPDVPGTDQYFKVGGA